MAYTVIRARVIDKTLRLINIPVLASGGVSELQIKFTFCNLWSDATKKTAVFYRNKAEVYHIQLTDDACLAPWEPFAAEGTVYVGVFAEYSTGTIRTSEVVALQLEQGAITAQTAAANAPDLYSALKAQVAALSGKVDELAVLAKKVDDFTTGDEEETETVENLFDGTLELIEGYRAQSTTAIDLADPQVPMDLVDATHWIYPELIELKQGVTYAFTPGHYFAGTIYKKLTGTKSGFVTYAGEANDYVTEGDNCLLYTPPATDSDFWLAISFHQNHKDVADFWIVEGTSLPEISEPDPEAGIFLREDIKIRALQVVGLNEETQAAINEVRELAEQHTADTGSAVLFTEQALAENQQAQARTNIGITTGYAGGSEDEEETATNLIDPTVGWSSGYGQLAGPVDSETLEVPFDTALLTSASHYTYNKLIPIKPSTTYAFPTGYTILATAFACDTYGRSGYVLSSAMTEGNGCLLWTSLGNTAGYLLSVSIYRGNNEDLDAFAIYEGTEIPTEEEGESSAEGEYLAESIKVRASQVVGLSQSPASATVSPASTLSVDNFDVLQPTARKIQDLQSPTTLTLALMSDTHYHDADVTAAAALTTARAMGLLGDFAHVDFIGNLGDMVRGNEAVEVTRAAMAKLVVSTTQNAKCPVLFIRGNHDDNGWLSYEYGGTNQQGEILNDKEWYQAVFGIKTTGIAIDPNRPCGGYGYWDDEKSKIRVFLLNSQDLPYVLSDGAYKYNSYQTLAYSNEQLNFVADSLQFADKERPGDWAALFLSHVPLDTTNDDGYRFGAKDHLPRGHECLLAIIAAYRKGTAFAYSGTTRLNTSEGDDFDVDIDVDYSAKGLGDVIGFISGHTHADHFSRNVGKENSLSRGYVYIGLMGETEFSSFVVDRENSKISTVKYGNAIPITSARTDLAGSVQDTPDTGTITSGEWSVTFNQFRPTGQDLYNGLSDVHAAGAYPDNSSNVDLETLELDTAPQSGNYITTKAIAVKPFTRYAIPSDWNGLIRAFSEAGGGSSWLTPTVEDSYKVVTTGIRHYYLVFSHHTGTYTDYANFKIKEIYSGLEF